MAKDGKKLEKAEEERKKRLSNKNRPEDDSSVLPAIKAGSLKQVA